MLICTSLTKKICTHICSNKHAFVGQSLVWVSSGCSGDPTIQRQDGYAGYAKLFVGVN